MSGILVTAALYGLAKGLWPALYRPVPVPTHMLFGGSWVWNAALRALLFMAFVAKLTAMAGVLGVAWSSGGTTSAVLSGLALALLLGGLWHAQQAEPRSCAAPLRDETGFLVGSITVAALAGLGSGDVGLSGLLGSLVSGMSLALGSLLLMALGFLGTWGDNPSFVVMRRPDFRVLGDNPDAHTLICRARVESLGLRVSLPRVAQGPVTFTVYSGRLRALAKVNWADLRIPLEAKDVATIHLGPAGDADFHLELEPGNYLLSVRNYRPFDRSGIPQIEVLR